MATIRGEKAVPAESNPETAAIEAAYKEQLGILYRGLCTNLTDMHGDEPPAVKSFKEGLARAQRARKLALDALASSPKGVV